MTLTSAYFRSTWSSTHGGVWEKMRCNALTFKLCPIFPAILVVTVILLMFHYKEKAPPQIWMACYGPPQANTFSKRWGQFPLGQYPPGQFPPRTIPTCTISCPSREFPGGGAKLSQGCCKNIWKKDETYLIIDIITLCQSVYLCSSKTLVFEPIRAKRNTPVGSQKVGNCFRVI